MTPHFLHVEYDYSHFFGACSCGWTGPYRHNSSEAADDANDHDHAALTNGRGEA